MKITNKFLQQKLNFLLLFLCISFSSSLIGQTVLRVEKETKEELKRSGETTVTLTEKYFVDNGNDFITMRTWTKQENRSSPTNLTADIPWDEDSGTSGMQVTWANNAAAEAAFNNARRQEEVQLALATNSLGNLSIPSGLDTDGLCFYVVNDERSVRNGIDYGSGAVTILPMQDIEYHIDTLASHHLWDMLEGDFFSHTGSDGLNSFQRLFGNTAIGLGACGGSNGFEFIPRVENLYAVFSGGTSNPLVELRSIYDQIYNDSNSNWGHRETYLLGNQALNGQNGFMDNFGTVGSEGLIGFALGGKDNGEYNPNSFPGINRSDAIVMNYFDPRVAGCSYQIGVSGESVLPVDFVSFEARAKKDHNFLIWEAYEQNVSHHDIEYSLDDQVWKYLSTVIAEQESTEMNRYTFQDKNISPLVVYYRIRSVDFDTSVSISDVVNVSRKTSVISIYPNPVRNDLTVTMETLVPFEYQIFDMQGKLVKEGTAESIINCGFLSEGPYFLKIMTSNQVITQKFTKI